MEFIPAKSFAVNPYFFLILTAKTQYRKFETNIPRKGIARPQIFNFKIHVSVSDLYIRTIGLPIRLQENMWTTPGNINRSQTHECGNWDRGGAIPRKEIHKWFFVVAVLGKIIQTID
jgi:hypothetical protein